MFFIFCDRCPYSSCQKRYYTVNSVNSHIRSHQHKDDEIRCQWSGCSKVFTKPCRLRAHMRTHTGDKPYLCTHPVSLISFISFVLYFSPYFCVLCKFICQGCFINFLFYFSPHFFILYDFICQGCTWAFTSSSKLRRHQFKHTNVRNFQCRIDGCGKLFMRSEHLKEHALTHSAERTFHCPHPSMSFDYNSLS